MVKGVELSREGIRLTTTGNPNTGKSYTYSEVDCQTFMELIFKNCGTRISYAGSNDMYRNACTWVGTLDQAKKNGYLVPGVALFIVENDGGEPAKYKGDGMGNASHVGMYVGSNALTDVDKNGKSRVCDVVHSSASMGRVAGSTLKNAWTHVGLWKEADFGFGNSNNSNQSEDDDMSNVSNVVEVKQMYVWTENREPVNFRTKPNKKAALVPRVPEIPHGAIVAANYSQNDWTNVTYNGYTGFVMSQFLTETENTENEMSQESSPSTEQSGSVLYRIYIDFANKEEAIAFQKAMQGCQLGSINK